MDHLSAVPPLPDDISDTEDFFEMSLDNLCVAGTDGYFKRVNPAWTRTLGWTAVELLSRPSIEFVHPLDRETTLAGRRRLQIGSEMGPLINRYLCKDGTFRWLEWRSIAHLDRGLIYAAARDITEQKLAAERLAQADEREAVLQRQLAFGERMASVGTLAGGVAHEVNNPLACVTANIAMILGELERTPSLHREMREMAVDIRDAAERIRQIVSGLKTFSRVEEEESRVVLDLRAVLDLATEMTVHAIRDRARLVKDYGEAPLVEADQARLVQVFVNLLVNAVQALPEGHGEAHEIRLVTSSDSAGRAVVEVRDTGSGIAAGVMPRIFDPFFTTKPVGTGTGLGLSICNAVVTGAGGEISAVSEPGRDTTFRVVLPAVSLGRSDVAAPAVVPTASARTAVLVVDDEPSVGAVLARVLREHDVTVVSAAGEALKLVQAGKHFDVIFSDLMMPEMSGMDFYEQLKQRFPDAARRVVFVSGGAFTPRASAFLDRVTNPRIEKPFDARAVRKLVEQLVISPRI